MMAKITLPVSYNVIWKNGHEFNSDMKCIVAGHKASSSKFCTHGSLTGIDKAFNLIYVSFYAMLKRKSEGALWSLAEWQIFLDTEERNWKQEME